MSIQRRLQRSLAKAFEMQCHAFYLAAQRTANLAAAVDLAMAETMPLFLRSIQAAQRGAVRLGALAAKEELGIEAAFSPAWPQVAAYVERESHSLVEQIHAETRRRIGEIIKAGQGWPVERLVRSVVRLYRDLALGRPKQHVQSQAAILAGQIVRDATSAGRKILVGEALGAGRRRCGSGLALGLGAS